MSYGCLKVVPHRRPSHGNGGLRHAGAHECDGLTQQNDLHLVTVISQSICMNKCKCRFCGVIGAPGGFYKNFCDGMFLPSGKPPELSACTTVPLQLNDTCLIKAASINQYDPRIDYVNSFVKSAHKKGAAEGTAAPGGVAELRPEQNNFFNLQSACRFRIVHK